MNYSSQVSSDVAPVVNIFKRFRLVRESSRDMIEG